MSGIFVILNVYLTTFEYVKICYNEKSDKALPYLNSGCWLGNIVGVDVFLSASQARGC